jgi:hypothetical protein
MKQKKERYPYQEEQSEFKKKKKKIPKTEKVSSAEKPAITQILNL